MARTIYCDSEDGQPAVMLVTNLETGEVAAICASCVAGWAKALLDALGEPGAEPVPEPAEDGQAGAGEGGAAPDPPRPKRRRPGAQEPPPEISAPSSPFPDVTPIDR